MDAPSPKKLDFARLSDATLGAFSRVAPSETLDHLLRYLSTWSGSDKLFMVIQYGAKVLVPILHLRARLRQRAGLGKTSTSSTAESLTKLAGLISEARALWGLWGILPIIQWLVALERSPPPTRKLLNIERTQGWAMLAFYPLDQVYYLITHGVMSPSVSLPLPLIAEKASSGKAKKLELNSTKLTLWSTRCWMVYVVLQLAHLREDRALLVKRQRSLKKVRGPEHAEVKRRWDAWYNELAVNLAYLPLTIHWSLEKGLIKNDFVVNLFGLAAALASFRGGWKAHERPAEPTDEPAALTTVEKPAEIQDAASTAI
ncbi:hypothetical protein PENSPDRAFT_750479 [Peniophora sp. CONT]|nr:hypothetical protein PENSPDRAFT_750479 [Peniophora sp. CONT]